MKRILNFFVAVDSIFATITQTLLIAILLFMMFLVASQVVLRNVFYSGISWADVAARHMVLWVAFLGAMLATRSRQHIAIDIITRFIPRVPRNALRIFLDAFACFVAFILAKSSLYFVLEERAMGSMLMLNIPTWVAQAVIPFGFAMISLEYAIGIGLDIYRIATHKPDFVAGRGRQ